MTITIYESVKPDKVIIESKREEFIGKYGKINVSVDKRDLFSVMNKLSVWINNDLKEEALFEIG